MERKVVEGRLTRPFDGSDSGPQSTAAAKIVIINQPHPSLIVPSHRVSLGTISPPTCTSGCHTGPICICLASPCVLSHQLIPRKTAVGCCTPEERATQFNYPVHRRVQGSTVNSYIDISNVIPYAAYAWEQAGSAYVHRLVLYQTTHSLYMSVSILPSVHNQRSIRRWRWTPVVFQSVGLCHSPDHPEDHNQTQLCCTWLES